MYEIYYVYGMNKGATITYTSTLEEATSFVKTKVYELPHIAITEFEKYRRKFLMSKFNNETLNPGEHFTYNGIEFICLDIIDGNYLAMTAKPYAEIPFDTNRKND